MRRLLLAFVLTGCAHQNATQVKQNAYVVGQTTKDVIDTAYGEWDKRANKRVDECVEKLPPEEHTKSEYDACVGPYNEQNQELAVNLLKGVRSAQLVLYIALIENKSAAEVQIALAQLVANVTQLRKFIAEQQ